MVQAESDSQKRDEYIQRLMGLPNQVFCPLKKPCHLPNHFYFFFFNFVIFLPGNTVLQLMPMILVFIPAEMDGNYWSGTSKC